MNSSGSDLKLLQERARWRRLLSGDSQNALWDQVTSAWHDQSLFWAINELRGMGEARGWLALNNGTLSDFIDRNYATTQMLRVYKLVDGSNNVNSILRLIKDIERNADLLTYKNILICVSAEYGEDFDRIFDRVSFNRDWGRLCAVDVGMITDDDAIKKSVFKKLRAALTNSPEIDLIKRRRHDFIAHARRKNNEIPLSFEADGLTLGMLDDALVLITRVLQFLTWDVLRITVPFSGGFYPISGAFKNLEKPVLHPDDRSQFMSWWGKKQETDQAEFRRSGWDLIDH